MALAEMAMSYMCTKMQLRLGFSRSGFHVTGPWSRYLGASLIPVDWQVGLFGPSGILDRPYECLYICTIPLSGCMDRHSNYIPGYLNCANPSTSASPYLLFKLNLIYLDLCSISTSLSLKYISTYLLYLSFSLCLLNYSADMCIPQ